MKCADFVAESLAVSTSAHLAHFSTKSYSKHIALYEFYDALTDLTDKYAEIYMGLEKQVMRFPSVTLPTTEPIPLLEEYLDTLRSEMAEDKSSQSLMNVLAEMEELTARALYKLKNLE